MSPPPKKKEKEKERVKKVGEGGGGDPTGGVKNSERIYPGKSLAIKANLWSRLLGGKVNL